MAKPAVYVASPLGFSEVGLAFYNGTFLPLLRELGFDPFDPWTLTDQSLIEAAVTAEEGAPRRIKWAEVNMIIGANNAAAIRQSQLVVAVLDGTDVDSGTAAEIGYAAALGIPTIGYRGDFRPSGDNPGAVVNLQVEYFIRSLEGEIATSLNQLKNVLIRSRTKLQLF